MSSRRRRRGRLTKLSRTDRQRKLACNERRGRPAYMYVNVNGARMRVPRLDKEAQS